MSKQKNKKKDIKKIQSYWIYYILIIAAGLIVFYNSLSNEFVFDDESVVLGDPTITDLSNIPKYFTAEEGFHRVIGRYYRPVVSATYAIDYALWKFDPKGFHFTNILIHIINSILLFKLLLLIFETRLHGNKYGIYVILLSALIFTVHTIHTEAVTWVSGRTDSLSFTFFALAFLYYLKFKKDTSNKNLYLTGIFYLLSLLAKEMAITFPVVIILYDIIIYYKNGIKKIFRDNLKAYLTLIGISGFYLIWRWFVLKDVPERLNYNYFYGDNSSTVIATMLTTVPLYFKLTFLPVNLLYHYNGYLPYMHSFLNAEVMLSVLFILIVIAVAVLLYKKLPVTSFSLLIFFVMLIPVMNIVPTMNFMAERFLYIPSIIVSFITAELIFVYWKEKYINFLYGIPVAIIVIYSILSVMRNQDWKNNNTLFLSAEGMPGTVTYVNIGNIHANNGKMDVAEVYYRKAIDIRDKTILANNNLGKIFMVNGNYDSAYYYMHKAYTLDSLSPEPMFSLGQLFAKSEILDSALHYLEKIQTITPNYMNSAKLLNELKLQKASPRIIPPGKDNNQMLKISQLQTQSYQAFSSKNYDKAIEVLNELIKIDPEGKVDYLNNLGMCYLEINRLTDAEKVLIEAVKNKPDYSIAYNNLGKVYEKQGRIEKAIEQYQLAFDTDPNNTEALNNLNKLKTR